MATHSRRLSILSSEEIDDLFGLPNFSEEDRGLYFDLSADETLAVGAIHRTAVAVNFILQLGYFKAKQRFFVFAPVDVMDDIRYVAGKYFPKMDLASFRLPSKPIRLEHQNIILKLFNYRVCDSANRALLENKAARIATISTHPIYVMRGKALNRGEAYHRLRRAVAFVNGGKFRVQTEAEQQIWNECSRLITNAIIYYNTALLSGVFEQKQAVGDQVAMDALRGISPVAWQHINLFGTFEFNSVGRKIDIAALVAHYANTAHWDKAIRKDNHRTRG